MFQLILGRPSSGKTYTVINKIKELAFQKKPSVLIVPEQFTFETERSLLKALGDSALNYTTVLSFSRLFDEIGRNIGGIAGITLSEADKIIFMHRTLTLVADDLKLWKKYAHSVSFAKTMLDSIGEFKINAITPEEIDNATKTVNSATLKSKLHDLKLIYETFDMLVGEKFIDPADLLTKVFNSLNTFPFFKEKTVFIDSFKGFTGQQFKIIERIFSQADDVYITINCEKNLRNEFSVFSNTFKNIEKIKAIAKSRAVSVSEPIILNKTHYNSESLKALERLLVGDEISFTDDHNNAIAIYKAETPFEEAEFAAATIRRLVRTEGYRFKDFVIITRNADDYYESVFSACRCNGVNFFYDNRLPLSAFPLSCAVESAIKALNLSTENLLRFHKTGLGTLNTAEISQLENYTYLWGIESRLWLKEWDMNPNGFVTEEGKEKSSQNKEKLKSLNELRVKAISPILKLKENFSGNAENKVRAIISLFKECDVAEKLTTICGEFESRNDTLSTDFLKQSYDEYMKILDSIVRCFGDSDISTPAFSEALSLAVSLGDIGITPQMLDEVTFGSADRIRPSRPKIAFILGMNQGVFPQSIHNSGVLNLAERKNLIAEGINISDNSVYSSIDEEYLVYCNLCCPSDKLYLSYSSSSTSGETLEPAQVLGRIKENLNVDFITGEDRNLPETDSAAFSEFCRLKLKNETAAANLKEALKDTPYKEKTEFIEALCHKTEKSISPETAIELYGKNLNMSASKFDTFNRCHFSFFCRYGLGIRKLQPAEFDVMQRGTIVHFVLERLITEHKEDISTLNDTTLNQLTERYIDEYLSLVEGFASVRNSRTDFLISRLSRSLKEVVLHIAREISQSDFKPEACELKIGGKDSEIKADFDFDLGKINLIGSIDRLDSYNGYIRIIDYKTGSKSFKLPDILFGLNMQMLIYLYAVIRANGKDDNLAAGILYQPSKRDINSNGMAMNGLLQYDEDLIRAMDKQLKGDFVPKLKINKDGSLAKTATSFIEKESFSEIFDFIEKLMRRTGNTILSGDIKVAPTDGRESPACKYCNFHALCGFENKTAKRVPEIRNDEVIKLLKEDETCGI